MSDFKAKMHRIRFRLGPRLRWGSLRRSPGFKGPTSKGRERKRRERVEEKEGRGKEKRKGEEEGKGLRELREGKAFYLL